MAKELNPWFFELDDKLEVHEEFIGLQQFIS